MALARRPRVGPHGVRTLAVGAVVLLAATVACSDDDDGREAGATRTTGPRPVVVDTDAGADDAMALLYLLQHPGVDVRAITVSGTGLAHCEPGVANVTGLVGMVQPDADIPVACGREEPLAGNRAFPDEWREQADGRYGDRFPEGTAPDGAPPAAELLAREVRAADGRATLLTLGPLTNVAEALRADPDLVEQIDRAVVMGGALDVQGNVQLDTEPAAASTEWNLYVDPTAAQAVLDSGVPLTLVPLDAQVPVDAYVARALGRGATTPPADAIAGLLRADPFYTAGDFYFWDPLAAAALADADLFSTTDRQVRVETQGDEAGRTVPGGRTVQVAAAEDDTAFVEAYLGRLDGRDEPLPVSAAPDVTISDSGGCAVSEPSLVSGPSVLALESGDVAAVGSLDEGTTDEQIEAFLATEATEAPPWFAQVAIVATDLPDAYAYLLPGDLTVICLSNDDGRATVAGRATITVTP